MSATATRAPRTSADLVARSRRKRRAATVAAMVALVAATIYFLLPIYWQVVSTTKSSAQLISTPPLEPAGLQGLFTNLSNLCAYDGGVFWRWLLNSLLYSVVGGLGATVICAMSGYAMARLRFAGRRALANVILMGAMIPATVLAFPLFLMLCKVGLVNTYWAVLLPSMLSPLGVFLARMFAEQSIPLELIEAARLDGAGEFRIAFSVAFRLMVPGLVTVFLIQFVAVWNNFFLPLIVLSDQNLFPVTLGLYSWNSQISAQPALQPLVITGSLIASIPVIILFFTLQRYWRSGMTSGALKA